MAGAKYSPGFDDPSARPRTMRARNVVGWVIGGLVASAVLGVTFAAYLSPSLAMDIGSVMAFCAQFIGLR